MIRYSLLLCTILFCGLLQLNAQSDNQAINKTTQQSSTSAGGPSNLAVDGNLDGNFNNGSVTQTNNEANAWWQVDLESVMELSLIKLFNRSDCCSERLSNFYVFISDTDLSGRSFTDIQSDCAVENIHISNEASAELNIPIAISGRYVRIQLVNTNILSLAEVQVYQSITSDPDCDDFCVIDDFDTRLNGSIGGQGNWEANPPGALDGAIISSDPPSGFIGKALMSDPNDVPFRGNAYKPLDSHTIPEGEKGTLFFQVLAEDLPNTYSHFGLTDLAAPRLTDGGTGDDQLYTDFEVQMSFDHSQIRVRNGSSNSYLTNIQPQSGVVYNVWMVVDNQNDTFEVFVQGGVHTQPVKGMTANGNTLFSFRNGSSESIQTLYLINSPDNVDSGVVYFDHFYFDNNKENLTLPIEVSPSLSYAPVETFDALNLGAVNGQNQWVADSNSTEVSLDPSNSENQVLKIGSGSMEAYHDIPQIRDCEVGTIFFRMRRSGVVNESVGLSDITNPSEFSDFENQINMQNSGDELNGRSGGSFLPLTSVSNNQWYCVWMVSNNPADTYQIYIQSEGESTPIKLSSGSLSDFAYRNSTASNALTSFFIKQNSSVGDFYIDDIYIDHNKMNLGHPSSGSCNHGDGTTDPSLPLNNPISETISPSGLGIVLEEFVTIPESSSNTPKARINFLNHSNDGSGRLFVNDLNNKLYVIENNAVGTYLDVSAQFSNFADNPRLGSGFGFFAFHPEFGENGKFYTVHTERFDALTNNTPDYTSAGVDDMHGIITEWTASDPSANTFSGTRREVLRIGFDTALHGFQQIGFNQNATSGSTDYGLLYLALGDGEENPVFSGGPQDLSVPHGKILCIDPFGNNASNGKYGIPPSNPFVSTINALGEIWAYGFRNPHRFSWDSGGTNKMFIANIGEKNADAVYLGTAGANYGWNEREGSFLFKKDDPNNVYALPSDDASYDYTYPVAEYDHDEGFAVVGGFVYRGNLIQELQGKYIFGDIVKGRIFYTEESDMIAGQSFTEIKELTLYDVNGSETNMLDLTNSSRADLRFGLDAQGEMYFLSKRNGKIWLVKGENGLNTTEVAQSNFKIFPNPVEADLNIKLSNISSGIVQISMLNALGQTVKVIQMNKASISLDVSDLPNGLYFITASDNKLNYTTKFIKK